MRRISVQTRLDWRQKVEEVGLIFHHTAEGLYWDESAYYEFSSREVDILEEATNTLQRLCIEAVQHVIDRNRFAELAIPPAAIPLIPETWERDPPSVYGRFDLSYDGKSPPKLLEYNADTPTALLESSVVQWFWLQDRFNGADQFNSIHERLLARWKDLRRNLRGSTLYFTCAAGSDEDRVTVGYLQDVAEQAGIRTAFISIEDIGWDHDHRVFVDLEGSRMTSIFKLYPWEWVLQETFGPFLVESHRDMLWIEPIWKLILSNKGILPVLWELNPGHPNLLECHFGSPRGLREYVQKPLYSREGRNIVMKQGGVTHRTPGSYGREGYVFQALAALPCFDGHYPVIGSWVIDGESAGIGIRETRTAITNNESRFVPHLFR
jgi:glutathionylspermidine synthase